MAGTSLAQYGPLLENWFAPGMISVINKEVAAYDDFEKEVVKWDGDFAMMRYEKGLNDSVQSAAENDILNAPGSGEYGRLIISAKLVYGSIGISGVVKAASETDTNGIGGAVETEMKNLKTSVLKRLNVYTFMGGDIPGIGWEKKNAVSHQYAGRYDSDNAENGVKLTPGVSKGLFIRLDTYDLVAGQPAGGTIITSIAGDPEATAVGLITFAAAVDTSAVPPGVLLAVQVLNTPQLAKDPSGFIRNMCSQQHYGAEQDRTTAGITATPNNKRFRGTFRLADPTVAALSTLGLDGLQQIMAIVNVKSEEELTDVWANPMQLTSYSTLLTGTASGDHLRVQVGEQGRMDFIPKNEKGSAGRTGYSVGGVPFRKSAASPNGLLFFINKDSWKRPTLKEGHWQNIIAGKLLPLPNQDMETARWAVFYEQVCRRPNANAIMGAIDLV